MLNKNIEVFMGCDASWEEADTVLFGAPFDSTTSFRPGTRFGCGAIRRESYGLECYSPYQDRDLEDKKILWAPIRRAPLSGYCLHSSANCVRYKFMRKGEGLWK